MTDAAPVRASPRRHRRRAWWVGACVVCCAVLVGWLAIPSSRAPFDEEVARLRAAGFATTFAEWYGDMPTDEENGAVDLDFAIRWFDTAHGTRVPWHRNPTTNGIVHWWEHDATPEEKADLEAMIASAGPFFDRLDTASGKPRFKFAESIDADGRRLQPWTHAREDAICLFEARGLVAQAPAERLAAIRGLARLASAGAIQEWIGTTCGRSAWWSAGRAGRYAVEMSRLRASDVRRALEPWPRERHVDAVGRLARGRIAALREMGDAILDGRAASLGQATTMQRTWESLEVFLHHGAPVQPPQAVDSVTPSMLAAELRHWEEVAACRPGRLTETTAWAKELDARSPREAQFSPSVASDVYMLARTDAQIALARVALAVAERHETAGAWPASLDDLRSEFPEGVPQDPYTDAPFVYQVMDDKVRISSVGRLPQDDPVDEAALRERGLVWEFRR